MTGRWGRSARRPRPVDKPSLSLDLLGVVGALALAYVAILALTIVMSFAQVRGYDVLFLDFDLSAYGRASRIDYVAIAATFSLALILSVLSTAYAILALGIMFMFRCERYVMLLVLPGIICSPALRAVALPISASHLIPMSGQSGLDVVLMLLCVGAAALPISLAVCLFGTGEQLLRYLTIYRNLGGGLLGALRSIVFPVAKASGAASVLITLPAIAFDPYAVRVAGGQVMPSVGALLLDLQSVSDWPLVAVVCILLLCLLAPVFLLLLPVTARGRVDA